MVPFFTDERVSIYQGHCLDVLRALPDGSVQCVVTSPPYRGLRDYGTDPVEWPDVTFCPVAGLPSVTVPAAVVSLGLEADPWAFIGHLVLIFREVRRVLADKGTIWVNMGDSYIGGNRGNTNMGHNHSHVAKKASNRRDRAMLPKSDYAVPGLKPKDMEGQPWRLAFALQADGWYLRRDIIWHKTNPMPESVGDRPTTAHEYLFLLSKSRKYYYNADAIKVKASPDSHARYARGGPGKQSLAKNFPSGWATGGDHSVLDHNRPVDGKRVKRKAGVHPKSAKPGQGIKANESFNSACKDVVTTRNKRSVWSLPTCAFPDAHFATFPPDLVRPCVLAGCPVGGVVMDPFGGSGTTGMVAIEEGRRAILMDLNPEYCTMQVKRTNTHAGLGI